MTNIGPILSRMWLVIREPAGDPRRATLIGVLIAVALLLVVALVSFLVSLVIEARRGAPARAAAAERRALQPPLEPLKLSRGRVLSIVAVLFIGLIAAYAVTGTNGYCGGACHQANAGVQAAAISVHRGVACVACHEQPLPAGLAVNTVSRISFAISNYRGAGEPSAAVAVDESRCLSCHYQILSGVVTVPGKSLRISHKEPIASGMRCDDCHSGYAHSAKATVTGMSRCAVCHDGKQASSACKTCHIGDPSASGVDFASSASKVTLLNRDCTGCHSMVRCDSCHGLRLPHPAAFVAGGHARVAAFGGKTLCWRCHDYAFCNTCHREGFQNPPHGANWKALHAVAAWNAPCGCHQAMTPGGVAPPKKFCTLCHTASDIAAHPK